MRSDRYAVLLIPGEENPESGFAPELGRPAGDVAVAQRIAAGDDQSWDSFLVAIRPMILKVAIDWCRRIAPGGRCRHCVAGVESDCTHFSGAEGMIEGRIRQKAMKAYKGQTGLALFIECLVGSDWWFWDYTDAQAGHLPPSTKAPTAQVHRADLVHAWAVLADSGSAWNAFLHAFNGYIEQTAITWCHRAIPGRVCRKCKPGVDHGCDAFGDAYLYILERLRFTALAAYGGRTSLRSFVYLCLHDYRWWASFVQKETGKIKLPKALRDEPKMVQQVYYRIAWGGDSERIAAGMELSPQVVEETRGRIEEKLRVAGRTLSSRRIETVSLSALSPGSGDDEKPRVAEPPSSDISPEVRAEAVRYWSRLPVQDRTVLRLYVESNKSVKEVAGVLGITAGQVYGTIYRIRREMPEWFKM